MIRFPAYSPLRARSGTCPVRSTKLKDRGMPSRRTQLQAVPPESLYEGKPLRWTLGGGPFSLDSMFSAQIYCQERVRVMRATHVEARLPRRRHLRIPGLERSDREGH
jgi:hypothetical protein